MFLKNKHIISLILIIYILNGCKTFGDQNFRSFRRNSYFKYHRSYYGNYCRYSDECQNNLICDHYSCRCPENYYWNNYTCDISSCRNDRACQTFDSKRKCNPFGKCVCNDGYTFDREYLKCLPNIGSFCLRNTDCNVDTNSNRVCAHYKCECEPNYRFSPVSRKCQYFRCRFDYNCQQYDSYRVCRFGDCECSFGFPERKQSLTCSASNSYLSYSILFVSIFCFNKNFVV